MPFIKKQNLIFLLLILMCFSGCRSTQEFSGYSYDPEGVTETYDRETNIQHKRTIGFKNDGVWISNEFNGARANDVYRLDKYHYRVVIEPEITPINNSPWYGFKIWSDETANIRIELKYPNGRQRYLPTVSRDNGNSWYKADSSWFSRDAETGNGILTLDVSADTVWVSAQEAYTTKHLQNRINQYKKHSYINVRTVGNTHEGRPVHLLMISEKSVQPQKGVVILYNRQHPPEVPGYKTGRNFFEVLASDSDLANEFRRYFDVWAFPMINPDGVDNGHWRTNAAGVDLNRDWQHFRQPETDAVRRALLPLKESVDKKVFYAIDFHSTGENVFYPINRDIETFPQHFTYAWAEEINRQLPDLNLRVEPFDTISPIAKNWTHKTFGVDAVTFEVWDELSRDKLEQFSTVVANTFMKMMIEEYKKEYSTAY